MFKIFKNNRLSLVYFFIIQFLIISFIVRLVLYIWSFSNIDFSIIAFFKTLFFGLFFDIGVISFFTIIYFTYLILFPNKWVGTIFDKLFTYTFYFITTIILTFSFFAEFTFWEEFQNRFNFIAVDYLIYTYEVVENINQSYPIPLLLLIIFLLVFLQYFILKKQKAFTHTFSLKITKKQQLLLFIGLLIPLFFGFYISNTDAEWSKNRYENEISKAGIYSFFAAFRNNELSYTDFYKTQDLEYSFKDLKQKLITQNDTLFSNEPNSIERTIKSYRTEIKPNVIFICLESFNADFLNNFGNKNNITPNLDSLINQSISFENLYATGTRTVRGMEAIMLSVPPSPGRSIVKRKDNTNLYNIGDVFKEKGYSRTFFYGGDGYFDNMNTFFGGNGFDIVDRGRGYLFGDSFTAKRTNIKDNEIQFENAWGVCDEDIYKQVIKEADKSYSNKKPFFNFIMTTSNHRPYTYPNNKIDIPSGTGRNGAVKYTDFAIGEFINKIKNKPWYNNTVIVFMADHCASSAGKWELNVDKYHIPAIIYNLPNIEPSKIEKQTSQIDLFPTLFGYLGWNYTSNFYGKDINTIKENEQRAFFGNYRKLGLLKGNKLTVLGDQKKVSFYTYEKITNTLNPEKEDSIQLKDIISYYQTNDYRYKNGLMKLKK
ncbi:phosphoglycerol transferase MdoB-like AlkP superfamily enzyme [Balneicella halophila]|uniref:Phosphoglycerol transferase MdoB-like AlkP superfamily enzyme n=1 Tax=Balneicella halophila TaxID=1537566 RepID=A0A7L4UMW7_BALHA|nr:alkaline phosphatase family protein [Balneicella halophila]PVX49815.1 phosphoglycerol transferase MdoB-like AlkP superfamily enzyme [Balneicella halophila]